VFLPGQNTVLWIGINHQYPCAVLCQSGREVTGQGRFPNPTLLIEKGRDVCRCHKNVISQKRQSWESIKARKHNYKKKTAWPAAGTTGFSIALAKFCTPNTLALFDLR
jgi:hypothetical protein